MEACSKRQADQPVVVAEALNPAVGLQMNERGARSTCGPWCAAQSKTGQDGDKKRKCETSRRPSTLPSRSI